jgi:hypothetical protein
MEKAGFHKLRLAAQENAGQAGELQAIAMQRDLDQALTGSGLFERVELGRTDDPDQMVIGLCRCAPQILPWEAGMGLERLWRSMTDGFRWEAHTVECSDSMMEFEGAVTIGDQGLFLTVHVVAEAAVVEVDAGSLAAHEGGPRLPADV